jgi:predicted nucleotide-binding protein
MEELGSLHNPWNPGMVSLILRLLRITDFPRILIVHGRADDRFVLKDYLQNQIRVPEPIIMAQRPPSGLTLPEKFEGLASDADGAIALVTPDDVGAFDDQAAPTALQSRARENAWLEVGWFWGRLGRRRFLLLVRSKPSIPSDLSGLEYVTYDSKPTECDNEIRAFIKSLDGTA